MIERPRDHGEAAPRFKLPDWPDGSYQLRVAASPRGASRPETVTQAISVRHSWRLMASTDKPVYQPGQVIRMRGLALLEGERPLAYVLYQLGQDGAARLTDLGAERDEQAAVLLAALQARHARITSVNEPSDSPLLPAFFAAGFREIDRQHELAIELASLTR